MEDGGAQGVHLVVGAEEASRQGVARVGSREAEGGAHHVEVGLVRVEAPREVVDTREEVEVGSAEVEGGHTDGMSLAKWRFWVFATIVRYKIRSRSEIVQILPGMCDSTTTDSVDIIDTLVNRVGMWDLCIACWVLYDIETPFTLIAIHLSTLN